MIIRNIFILPTDQVVALNIVRDLVEYRKDIVILCSPEGKIEWLKRSQFKTNIEYIDSVRNYFDNLERIEPDEINLIFPTHDLDWFKILAVDSVLEKCFIPDVKTLKIILDKERLYNFLQRSGVPFLKTFSKVSEIVFPVVVKEKRRIKEDFWRIFHSKFLRVSNKEELEKAILTYGDIDNLIFQENLPKTPQNEFSVIGYRFKNGQVIGKCVQKTHQIPQGGVTTFAEYYESERIQEYGKKILDLLSYNGIFEIEFLYSKEKDEYYFIDFNARCCHWYNMLSGSGINLPLTALQEIKGINGSPPDFYPKKFMDLKSELMSHVIYGNTLWIAIIRLGWLLRTIRREDIVFAVYSRMDKPCSRYLLAEIFRNIYRYYFQVFFKVKVKKLLIRLGMYRYLKKAEE